MYKLPERKHSFSNEVFPKIPTYYLIFAVTMGDSCGSDDHSSYLLLGEKLSGILASN